MTDVTLYTKNNCPLCDDAEEALRALEKKWDLSIKKMNIYENDALLERYHLRIPVVKVNGEVIVEGIVDEYNLNEAFEKMFQNK